MFVLAITIVFTSIACAKGDISSTPTGTSTVSPTSILTEPPVVTDVPMATEAPTAKEVPATPSPDPTSTPVPSVTTAISDISKEYTFDFSQTSCLLAHSCSYEIDEASALMVHYDTQYGQMMLALPEAVDMAQCDRVTVRAKNEYGMMSVKLFEEAFQERVVFAAVV